MNKPQIIILHHSASGGSTNNDFTEANINSAHQNRGFPKSNRGMYVGYHYIIYPDGQLRKYRGHNEIGAHCKTDDYMNRKSIGICLIGNFSETQPSKAQAKTLLKLCRILSDRGVVAYENIAPHRKYQPTQCPGNNIPDDLVKYFKELANEGVEPTARQWADKYFPEIDMNKYDAEDLKIIVKRVLAWARS